MQLSKSYPTHRSSSITLSLDTIANTVFFFVAQWSPDLKRNQSRDVMRALVSKLYGASRGSLFHAQMKCSHAALAEHLNLSREWVCTLIARLRAAGWIETSAPRLAGSQQQDISTFRAGRMLKRLLVMLLKSREKSRVNDRTQKIPTVLTKPQIEKGRAFFAGLIEQLGQKMKMRT